MHCIDTHLRDVHPCRSYVWQCFEAELDNLQKNVKANLIAKSKTRKLASGPAWDAKPKSSPEVTTRHKPNRREHAKSRDHEMKQVPGGTLKINGKVTIEVTQGDITEESTDAIVNSTDDQLGMRTRHWFYFLM